MNSKELFEKIKSSITEALNKEDGIMLGDKKLLFGLHDDEAFDGKKRFIRHGFVEVHVYYSEFSRAMWFVDVHEVFYHESAAIYAVEELKKNIKGALISRNDHCSIEKGFQIAITFDENVMNS